MKTTKALAVVAFLVALASAGAAGVRGADPSPEPLLGANIQSKVYLDQGGQMVVINKSNVPARFTFQPAEGWEVAPLSATLGPDERVTLTVTGTGVEGTGIEVRVESTQPVPEGMQASELLLVSEVFYEAPFDLGRLVLQWLPVVAGVLLLIWIVWRVKPWTIRLTRKES